MPHCAAFAGPSGPAFFFFCLSFARPSSRLRGWVGFLPSRFAAVLVSLTTGPHASNRAGLGLRWCRFSILSPKPHTGPHRAELGISPLFPGMFLPWQSCQLAFQVVVDSFLNGEDRVKQRPVSRSAVQCPHRCRQRFDEILIL